MLGWWLYLAILAVIFPFYLRWSVIRNRKNAARLVRQRHNAKPTTLLERAEDLVMWMAAGRLASLLDPLWERMDGFMDALERLPFIPKEWRKVVSIHNV
jgi:hypothetical protein